MHAGTPARASLKFLIALLAAAAPLAARAQSAPAAAPAAAPAPALRGIVLLDNPQAVKADGLPTPAETVDATRAPAIPAAEAKRVLGPFLGKPLDPVLLAKLRDALQDYFIKHGQSFVSVIVPPQTVDGGVVQIEILVGRLGKLTVEGNKWFAADQYTGAVHLESGKPIDVSRLDADIDWINTNPFRHATVVARPGQEVGATDIVVRTQETRPVTVRAGLDNTGTASTSVYRVNTGVEWGNAFGRGDDANVSYTTTPDFYTVHQYGAGYSFALPWRDSLSLNGSYATSHPPSGSVVGNVGVNAMASLRYVANLPARPQLKQSLVVGYDFKSANNNLLFGGASIFATTTEIDQFTLGYRGQERDRMGVSSFDIDLFASPGGLTAGNNDAAFESQQAGAKARYFFARLSADRQTPLAYGMVWDLHGTFQVTGDPLLASEQMVIGGSGSVRGFEEQAVSRDQGVTIENELRFKPIPVNLTRRLGAAGPGDQLAPFVFIDYGRGWNVHSNSGVTPPVSLASLGPGFAWQAGRLLSVRFSYGFAIDRDGVDAPKLGPQFGIQLGF